MNPLTKIATHHRKLNPKVVCGIVGVAFVLIFTRAGQSDAAVTQIPSPIGPATAAALGMVIAPAATEPSITVDDADKAALDGWPGCATSGDADYVNVKWSQNNTVDGDVFLVPITCPYGNEFSLAGPYDAELAADGSTGVAPTQWNLRVAVVSPDKGLLVTISGLSLDPSSP